MTSRRSSLDASAAHAGGFFLDDTPTEEVDRREAVLESLAGTVRDLVDAAIRTTVEDEEVLRVRDDLAALVARLRASQLPGPAGVRFNADRRSWNWGNAVVGAANGIAPPLRVVHGPDGCHADVRLGAAYEGPPGLVHGGVSAMLLDHIMGETASGRRRTAFTGTLTMRYRRGTPLGPLRLEARVVREEGRKIFVDGSISDAGGVTVEAEGIFIQPAGTPEFPRT
ncbi:acyl-coenzyme A thioesterase PaaI-like protein [Actinomadura hallensis]|uniref:Acyl-coenzyme A thioesterase THEM4 n=1 Tax=Actinomadura hallensis TaxID=337895 RepID=A0A543IGD3_9ACTN|nr:PaaI family thioesterase [Actinomadura hallensis]TQM69651.1 acyl-coenzyme A thioesterase PaaI-like protein [Actinomadura hallensis]